VDARDRDLAGYVADAKQAVAVNVTFPPGYFAVWGGQSEYYARAKQRLAIVVPLTLTVIFLLLYLNFRRLTETLIVMLSLPFELVGGLWMLWGMGFNLSVAVAVGFIALAAPMAILDGAIAARGFRTDYASEWATAPPFQRCPAHSMPTGLDASGRKP